MLSCQLFQPQIPCARRNKEEYDRAPRTLGLSKTARALTNPADVFMPESKDDALRVRALCYIATRDSRYF